MFSALLETTERTISNVRRVLDGNEILRSLFESAASSTSSDLLALRAKFPENTDWRVHESSSSILLLYSIFERFVETLLSDYLTELPQYVEFEKLPTEFRRKYTQRVGTLLANLEQRRYRGVDAKALIGDYSDCLRGVTPYRIDPKPMVMHSENFRMPTVESLFRDSGLDNVSGWVANDSRIKKFLVEKCDESATAVSELARFVELRNDAAHGVPYTLPSISEMRCHCEFISAICESLHSYVVRELLFIRKGAGMAEEISYARELLKDGYVVVGDFENMSITVGTVLYFVTENSCVSARIKSIQKEGKPEESYECISRTELGLGLDAQVKKDSRIFRLVEARPSICADNTS